MDWLTNRRLWLVVLLLLALLAAAYAYVHAPLPDDDELHQVTLDPANPDRTEIGELSYLGGLDIPRMGQNIGGISGLRWDDGQFVALLDDGRWMRFATVEDDGRLIGIKNVRTGDLLGLDGEPLSGKAEGDAEGLTRSAKAGWLVSFEREHRIWHYPGLMDHRSRPNSIRSRHLARSATTAALRRLPEMNSNCSPVSNGTRPSCAQLRLVCCGRCTGAN